jgi:hypothetical protein
MTVISEEGECTYGGHEPTTAHAQKWSGSGAITWTLGGFEGDGVDGIFGSWDAFRTGPFSFKNFAKFFKNFRHIKSLMYA